MSKNSKKATAFKDLTAVMLDFEPLTVLGHMPEAAASELFFGEDDRTKYMQGAVAEATPHLTLKFGFPPRVSTAHKQAVLAHWVPEPITVRSVSHFPGRIPGLEYSVIIAEVYRTPNLESAYARLSLLPNEDEFPEFRPHVTLAYLNTADEDTIDRWVSTLTPHFEGMVLTPTAVNYGED